jgi:predicted metal-dependent HD superfamily phosphohydrolase
LFHDTGFLIDYQDHEEQSIKMAREILPLYKYTEEQIQIIARLIYATKLPPNPQNKLEEIMCDADLDYLGRKEFVVVSQDLYKELFERGVIRSVEEWNKMQVRFIENHQYFTKTARNLRRVNKLKQLEAIRNWVEKNEQEKS